MPNIRLIEKRDAASVALLHQSYLSTPFHSAAGLHLLKLYYKNLVQSSYGVGYIAVDDNTVVGYVCGVWDAAALQRMLTRNSVLPLLFWMTFALITSPAVVSSMSQRVEN